MNKNGKSELIMESLNIRRRATYEANAGKYVAEIQYESQGSKHTLTLDEMVSERVLAFIGPVICEAAAMVARETAKNITRSIEALNNQRAIEAGDLVNAGVSQTAAPEQWRPSGSDQEQAPPTPAQPVELLGPDSIPPCDRVPEDVPAAEAYQVPKEPGDVF